MRRLKHNEFKTIGHVGWGDKQRYVVANLELGWGVRPKCNFGPRRMVWDAAFGYVNGFRKRDILYYVLTRSMSKRVWERVALRNEKRGRYQERYALDVDMKEYVLETGHHF